MNLHTHTIGKQTSRVQVYLQGSLPIGRFPKNMLNNAKFF